ncbi:MAG TPA: hypothetical protein VG456_18740 [Candidatus Sulfopaludibacter sp.]|jgi:hypothetical protein|nr:hypothetical protein [Candidatus Sulfopaludibacter sp.]
MDTLTALNDMTASQADRMFAAGMAGEINEINDEVSAALLKIVADPAESEELRAVAAISLGPVLELVDLMEPEDVDEEAPISGEAFLRIKKTLHRLFEDTSIPKEVRRRILEASVRSEDEWHDDAVAAAYRSGERDWVLTAVFAMRFVGGFERQVLESLNNPNEEIHVEAIQAAGAAEMDAAWPHLRVIIKDRQAPKPLLIAAILAAGEIGGDDATEVLEKLPPSDDEDIAAATDEALSLIYDEAREETEDF